MNTLEYAKRELQEALERAMRQACCVNIAERLNGRLSDFVSFYTGGQNISIIVTNREDLQTCMTLCPVWAKEYKEASIVYKAEYQGLPIVLEAYEGALPATCKMVEEEEIVPAQEAKPATTRKVRKLKCDW